MIRHLDRLADRACWIAGDRVNALIAVEANGIAELGFHGLQPVSRNSRMFVRPSGTLSISVRDRDGGEYPLTPSSIDWQPYGIHSWTEVRGQTVHVTIVAGKRFVRVAAHRSGGDQLILVLRFSLSSCFRAVRGDRTWSQPEVRGGWLHLHCRDRIMLKEWIRQTGPYAGDFLIPEPWRRLLFTRSVRSGLASHQDLRPEFRDLDVPLYDAETWIRLGGEGVVVESNLEEFIFFAPLAAPVRGMGDFFIEFSECHGAFEDPGILSLQTAETQNHYERLESRYVRFRLPGYPSLQQVLTSVPGIVRSATVRDFGMTRASPGAYYWIWAWDNLVVGQEAVRWGETETASDIARFITTHRDAGDAIPARWTRSGLPLDTPPQGALEFLLLHLTTVVAAESGITQGMLDLYPVAARFLRRCSQDTPDDGMPQNISFYPDNPAAFGRTEQSVVALESGALYSFCRLMENAACLLHDDTTANVARTLAGRIAEHFLPRFWDDTRGFLRDAFDRQTGESIATFPLFTLLFLQTPLGLALIRPHLARLVAFMRTHLQSVRGVRMLPVWDIHRTAEIALSSWYPHWDIYLLKLYRRAGERTGIMEWLRSADETVAHLGYVPEYLVMDDAAEETSPGRWLHHGAASNLNCATGWFRTALEGVYGLEFDPGGMTVLPLDLPLDNLEVRRLRHRSSSWHVKIEHRGPALRELRIDGTLQRGCTKIPATTHDGTTHLLEVLYGSGYTGPSFSELINGEVLESQGDETHARVLVRALGMMDIAVAPGPAVDFAVDGKRMPLTADISGGGYVQVPFFGVHELTLSLTS